MARYPAAAVILALLAGCGAPPVKEVKVPVYLAAPPPTVLLEPVVPAEEPLPQFVSPTAPDAALCLSQEAFKALQRVLIYYDTRVNAWEAYAREMPALNGLGSDSNQ